MTRPAPSRRTILRTAGLAALGAATGVGLGATSARAATKNGPLMTCYVEVNSHSIANVGKYQLANSRANVFDIGIIFASNINYDGQQAYLHHNENVQRTLDNAATEIRPLQAKGIKVLLSILGNHQGAGFGNFPDYAAADAFAAELADAVYTYGLDGIDFDDEYANYGANGTGPVNDWSFVYLCQALRARMPDKLITLYWYGPITSHLEYGGVRVGDLIDYSWNAIYGSWIVPGVAGLTRAELAPAAINIQGTGSGTAKTLATRTVNEGYGVYNTYNLGSSSSASYLTTITRELYGERTRYTG